MGLNSKIGSVFQNDPILTTFLDGKPLLFKWLESEGNCLVISVQHIDMDARVLLLPQHFI